MKQDTLAQLNAERLARRPVVVITNIATGEQRLVKAADVAKDPLRAELDKHLRMNRSKLVHVDGNDLFLNIYAPTARLVIIGAVHISQTLAPLAQSLGYDVYVVDPRTAFASPERFPDVRVVADWPETVLPAMNIDRYTALAAVTHDPKIDDFALLHALERDCFYIGALGSRKTHGKRLDRLRAAGETDSSLSRIRSPIGMDIGAVSPPEIAVAVMAQITAALRLPASSNMTARVSVPA